MDTRSETKYERLRKIGVGSYGVVFKCVNRQTGQIVAIKRYSENDSDPAIRKIAMREVRMLRQLRHPNLIRLIEVFRRKRILHLVFDYCELTVLDVIEKYANNCPLNLIKKIVWQLVNGVSHCHSHNCIHRDIKPENILINQSGMVKLCDFGFARTISTSGGGGGGSGERTSSNSGGSGSSSSRLAAAAAATSVADAESAKQQQRLQNEREAKFCGVFMPPTAAAQAAARSISFGANSQSVDINNNKENLLNERQALTEYVATRWYRAPELLVGEIYYDIKIDIWAIGCVTAELMRGESLWSGRTDLDQLCLIMSSLGQLTSSQMHTLLWSGHYDSAGTERVLNYSVSIGQQQQPPPDQLERKLPARVGPHGVDFVAACLRMNPEGRLTSDDLLKHAYIQSTQMSQFVKGAAAAAAAATAAASASHTAISYAQHTPTRLARAQPKVAVQQNAAAAAAADSPPPLSRARSRASNDKTAQLRVVNRSNSQAILRAANSQQLHQQPPSKRLVLAPADSSSPASGSSSTSGTTVSKATGKERTHHSRGSLVPVPIRTAHPNSSTHTAGGTSEETGAVSTGTRAAHKRKELTFVSQPRGSVGQIAPQTMGRVQSIKSSSGSGGGRMASSSTNSSLWNQEHQKMPTTTTSNKSHNCQQGSSHLPAALVSPARSIAAQRTNVTGAVSSKRTTRRRKKGD